MLVVCAGAKSILDLGLTLEYLETKGVPVIGYGTEELPAFYTRTSGFKVDYGLDTPEELAAAFHVGRSGLGRAACWSPTPSPSSIPWTTSIRRRHRPRGGRSPSQGIHGKETTPFLLAKIKDITGGDSLARTYSWCTTTPVWPRRPPALWPL